jgi:hypothetical protein
MEWMNRLIVLKGRKVSSLAMILVSLSVVIVGVLGVDYNVGIKAGDWVKYGVTSTGNPPDTYSFNLTWMKIEFVSVNGTSVTYLGTLHLQNGTETNGTATIDLASTNPAPLIPANSKVGDTIYSGASSTVITGETTRSYAGASRTVLNASVLEYGGNTTYYFDKQTGVAVEVYAVYTDYTLNLVVTETNLWDGRLLGLDWWAWVVIIVVVAVVVVAAAAALMLRRRKHTAPTPSQEVLPPPPPSSS